MSDHADSPSRPFYFHQFQLHKQKSKNMFLSKCIPFSSSCWKTLQGYPPCNNQVFQQNHAIPAVNQKNTCRCCLSSLKPRREHTGADLPSCDIPSATLPQISSWSVQSQLERGLTVWAALNFYLNSLPPACISKNKENNFRYYRSEWLSSS